MFLLLLIGGGLLFFRNLFGGGVMPLPTTPPSQAQFVAMMFAAIRRVYPFASQQTQRLIVAHAAYETGWGKSTPFMRGWNAFNITRLPSDTRPVIQSGDLEYAPDGTVRKITQRFAAYPSLDESIHHYLSFIGASRYTNARDLLTQGTLDFVDALSRGGYFTLPLAQYKSAMQSVLASVTRLAPPAPSVV